MIENEPDDENSDAREEAKEVSTALMQSIEQIAEVTAKQFPGFGMSLAFAVPVKDTKGDCIVGYLAPGEHLTAVRLAAAALGEFTARALAAGITAAAIHEALSSVPSNIMTMEFKTTAKAKDGE